MTIMGDLILNENNADSDVTDDEYSTDNNDETDSNNSTTHENNKLSGKAENNLGWADSIAKILRTKKPKGKKTLVLSKAKKITDLKTKPVKEIVGFEIEGEIKEDKPDASELHKIIELKSEEPNRKKRKKELPSFRVKPNILDKDQERILSKIATRGVVQLFNAVRLQQNEINEKLQEAGPLEQKREKVIKTIDKRAFLHVLAGDKLKDNKNERNINENREISSHNTESTSKWNVLRDDFMMGAKMKDWDKNVSDDEEESVFSSETDSD